MARLPRYVLPGQPQHIIQRGNNRQLYLLTVIRYIELNPVRAGLAAHPREYPWSSYAHNAVPLQARTQTGSHHILNICELRAVRWRD